MVEASMPRIETAIYFEIHRINSMKQYIKANIEENITKSRRGLYALLGSVMVKTDWI